jgi:PPOX class probable F420-dependent enzyme
VLLALDHGVAGAGDGGGQAPFKVWLVTVELNDAVRRLLDEINPAVLGTINPDGSPQTSVVWVATDGGDLVISSAAGRRKVRNVQRDPRVSLIVYDRDDPQLYAEIRGLATVSEDIGRELAVRLEEQYEGPGAGAQFLALPPEVVRVVIRISPQRVTGRAGAS